jgi:hypothetical protein
LEEAETEIKSVKLKIDEVHKDYVPSSTLHAAINQKHEDKTGGTAAQPQSDGGELKFIVERQEAEILQMSEELYKLRSESAQEREKSSI